MNSKTLVSRAIFVIVVLALLFYHTIFSFNGLTSSGGVDQAQVAREVAQGHGFSTQMLRPQQLNQLQSHGKEIQLHQMPETYHSPLNIMVYAGVLKLIGADDVENFTLGPNDKYYVPDQAIAITCAIFFIISIGISYLLITRIFDAKIATVVAIIMATSSDNWNWIQSGLPQMLMLTLFSTALYLVWKAVERQKAGISPTTPAILAAFFFGLLALSHWMTLWIFIGYFIFATFYFQPRGVIALACAAVFIAFITPPIIYYTINTGEPLGTAFHAIHGATGASEAAMRQVTGVSFNVKNLLTSTLHASMSQMTKLGTYLGGLVIAPAFFLSLAHPFRRATIAEFRWALLLLWVFASIAMGLYGLNDKNSLEPNQMHLLFAPLMTAYALALVSIIWSRCELSKQGGALGNLHMILIVIIAATPMFLKIKGQVKQRNESPIVNGVNAYALNHQLREITKENDIIISDQPWAVAWYADRTAIWLPLNSKNLNMVEDLCEQLENPVAGIHMTGSSNRGKDIRTTLFHNRDLAALSLAPWMANFSRTPQNLLLEKNPSIAPIISSKQGTYKYIYPLVSVSYEPAFYYSRRDLERNY